MALSMRSKFVVFGAVPVTVLSIAGAAAFTFGQDISQINGTQEQSNYLVVASNATSTANNWHQQAYVASAPGLTGSMQDVTVATKYGELPQWFQVNSGAIGFPSAVQEPGDLAFINGASSTTAADDTNNGNDAGGYPNLNVVQAIHVKGNITNVAALRQAYGTCLIPIRLWKTVNTGSSFTDVTQTYLDTQNRFVNGTNDQTSSTANPNGSSTDPFYVDCTTGEFEFTVPTDVSQSHVTRATLAYELSVERGGVFTTTNNNTGAQPEFVFQATPIAYDPTNQFNAPGGNGNSQYTPNVKNDVRKAPVTVTVSGPPAILVGTNYPTITYTTSPSPITWITEPTCGVYASNDSLFETPLTGASAAGTFVTHCAGGVSARYAPTPVDGSLIVVKYTTTVTASSPSSITVGDNYPSISFTTNPSPITWISEPTCGVYAGSDTTYSNALSGASTLGTYVTHCTGGTAARYAPFQANGSLTVRAAGSVGTPLPSLVGRQYMEISYPTNSSTWSAQHPVLLFDGGIAYDWVPRSQVSNYLAAGSAGANGQVSAYNYFTMYYSPDGVNYTAFP